MRTLVRPLAGLSVALLLVAPACKKKEAAPTVDSAAVAPAPPPAPVVTALELGKHVGPNRRVMDTTSVFARRDTLYLSVVGENIAAGSTLLAKWTFQTGQLVDSTAQAAAAGDAANPVSVTEFHLVKPSGWPRGKYRVEVWLNGASVGTRELEVR
jgi:hypothetical protein